jgi:cobalt-zinc-cadmium efflux system outer membrane protein
VAESESQRAQARVNLERALRMPQPTIKLSSERDQDATLWRVGVVLPLPLWSRRAGPIAEAVAGMDRSLAEAKQIRLDLLAELDHAYSRYQIARHQVMTFESGLLKEAESALKVAEAAYRYGERGILDYLDAQRVLRATRIDFLNARYELQAALIVIERLRATPLTAYYEAHLITCCFCIANRRSAERLQWQRNSRCRRGSCGPLAGHGDGRVPAAPECGACRRTCSI